MRLVVFSDDWGRSPSSCQHLVRRLLPRYSVLWVNTIGTRPFRFSADDMRKATGKLKQWMLQRNAPPPATAPGPQPDVINPLMVPGFGRGWQRSLNAGLITRSIHGALGRRADGERRVAITTIPITADLPGRLDVDAWVYYCVDDLSVWPGLDQDVMDRMERAFVPQADRVISVSETLQRRVRSMGAESVLLTHGIDAEHWETTSEGAPTAAWTPPESLAARAGAKIVFWGVVDRRLDTEWCLALAERCGTLVIFGPVQEVDAKLSTHPNIELPGPIPYADLPHVARFADVLVMPYADLPVTRAIQPLKFKEYLATGRPVVARRLSALAGWDDAADLVDSAEELVRRVEDRVRDGVPPAQTEARARLKDETWAAKAEVFEREILAALEGDATAPPVRV